MRNRMTDTIKTCSCEAYKAIIAELETQLSAEQARVKELEEALQVTLTQMEEDIVTIDGEWGSGRTLEGIERDGELWPEIIQARKALQSTPTEALDKVMREVREECAKICERKAGLYSDITSEVLPEDVADECAEAIREGNKT